MLVFSTSKTDYKKGDYAGFDIDSWKTAYKCIKTACPKGDTPTKTNGWKEFKIKAVIKTQS
jgi:hypothetical protein